MSEESSGRGGGRAGEAPPARRLVLGVGNLLNSDEGLGVHAVHALRAERGLMTPVTLTPPSVPPSPAPVADGVELLDGGVLGLDLLPLVEECSHILVLDAVDAGAAPGALVELVRDDAALFRALKLSQHQVTMQDVLALARLRDRLPADLRILGVQPSALGLGLDLSPVVAEAFPLLLARARAIIAQWNAPT